MIAIFLNNKIITADTVVPIALEIRKVNPNREIFFYCNDNRTASVLMSNFVLMDCMRKVGQFKNLGSSSRSILDRAAGICKKGTCLLFILTRILVRKKVDLLHFWGIEQRTILTARTNESKPYLFDGTYLLGPFATDD